MAKSKYLSTLFLRYEPTTDPHFSEEARPKFRDVAVYLDGDCTIPYGRFRPGSKRPSKNMDQMVYNGGWRYNIEWLDDASEPGTGGFEPGFDKKRRLTV
jgi:hypothetical protein